MLYCNEYDAYVGFTNFIHQHYFFDLFKGHLSDVKLNFLNNLPLLDQVKNW